MTLFLSHGCFPWARLCHQDPKSSARLGRPSPSHKQRASGALSNCLSKVVFASWHPEDRAFMRVYASKGVEINDGVFHGFYILLPLGPHNLSWNGAKYSSILQNDSFWCNINLRQQNKHWLLDFWGALCFPKFVKHYCLYYCLPLRLPFYAHICLEAANPPILSVNHPPRNPVTPSFQVPP